MTRIRVAYMTTLGDQIIDKVDVCPDITAAGIQTGKRKDNRVIVAAAHTRKLLLHN